jgi:predicted NAD/FAD-dependent oxidoreductase
MTTMTGPERTDVVAIGAGMAGLRAAALLAAAGREVIVLDKGRRHGGRMATRRVDDATFDTGAIHFTAETEDLATAVARWAEAGSVTRSEQGWRGTPTMRSLPTAIADEDGLTVRLSTEVTALTRTDTHWVVTGMHEGKPCAVEAKALVLTAPAPQAIALLGPCGSVASSATLERLAAVLYAPSLTVLARPVAGAQPHGSISRDEVPGDPAVDLARIHRNDLTGASSVVALTLQATPSFSAAHLDGDRGAAAAVLAAQASRAIGIPLEVVHVHGWRYAQVVRGIASVDATPALHDDTRGAPLVLAGDLFDPVISGSPTAPGTDDAAVATSTRGVERAFLSGTAAAGLLLDIR